MNRINKITDYLKNLNLDALLLTSEENCHYVCGFSPSEGKILITKNGTAIQFVDSRYTVVAQRYSKDNGLTVIEISSNKSEEIKQIIENESLKKVGFEGDKVSFTEYKTFNEILHCELVSVEKCLMILRNSKSKEELEYLIKAQRIAEKAYIEILNIISVGKSEKKLANELEYLMKKYGSHGTSFDTIFVSGVNTSMPHGVPSEKTIEDGDFITMDFGAMYKGYHSDMTRTVAVGHATDEMINIYETVLNAQLNAIDNIAVGKKCSDIYYKAFDIINDAGYGSYFKHGLGHGVGLEIHEGYSTAPNCKETYDDGYVTSVEPGIYLPEKFGVRIEDVLYLGNDGNYNLMNVDKQLIIL